MARWYMKNRKRKPFQDRSISKGSRNTTSRDVPERDWTTGGGSSFRSEAASKYIERFGK